ncbi:MAG: DUF362 domain-containing protein [Desulfobacteraceae bacterium]|jgi:uncharacterized protein (DUF362 family)|nr:DUF362 domain-containing protein [Desulfobacteraceae bacterium]
MNLEQNKNKIMPENKWSRRDFLKLTGAAACAAVMPACAHRMETTEAEFTVMPVANDWTPHVAGAWIPKGEHADAYDVFKKTIEASTDFSWLSKSDSVLIKLSLNSGNPYPATSDPWALAFMIRLLREKGAGRIMAGDSSGVESVLWTKKDQKGSSRECCKQAGLFDVIEQNRVEAVFFEEQGYDAFMPVSPAGLHHWKEPLWVTSTINETDHIIYLARVSSHVLGDITSGMKIGVGFLREDSRKAFHQGGDSFYAMYEEINQIPAISSKLRLVVSSGRNVLATFGPDKGHVTAPDLGLIISSEDLFAHEILAYAWLLYNREFETDFFDVGITGRLTKRRSFINKGFVWVTWEDSDFNQTPAIPLFIPGNIYAHPSMMNFMKRKGGRPANIDWEQVNAPAGCEKMADYINGKIATTS